MRGSRPRASGPYLQLSQTEVVANPADLGLAVLGGPQAAAYLSAGLGPGFREPADLLLGRDHRTTDEARSPSVGLLSTAAAPTPVVAEPAQTRAVSQIVAAVSGSATVLARRLDPVALARPRGPGDPIMRSHHRHPGLTGTVVKVVVFTVVSVILTSIVISTLLDVNTQAATGYVAQFSNASGAAGR